MAGIKEIWLVRHGITEWSKSGKHTSYSDIDLIEEGVKKLPNLSRFLEGEKFDQVFASTSLRSRRTAEILGFKEPALTYDLNEWNYGQYEGLTTPQIRQMEQRDWTVFKYGCPGGESPKEVSDRVDRFLNRIEGKCLLFLSGHIGRALIARYLKLPIEAGAQFVLEAGKLSKLGFEHESAVICGLNLY
jgi:broad specificity phosphatase PhoE